MVAARLASDRDRSGITRTNVDSSFAS